MSHVHRATPSLLFANKRLGRPSKRTAAQASARPEWRAHYARRLALSDACAVVFSVAVAHLVRFGLDNRPGEIADSFLLTAVLAVGWLVVLAVFRTRSSRSAGTDLEEFRRIVSAASALFAAIAVASFIFGLQLSRGYVALALLCGLVAVVAGRMLGRRALASARRSGRCATSVVVVGSRSAAAAMAASFDRDPGCGYRVTGVWTPSDERGGTRSVLDEVTDAGADIVVVTATEALGDKGIRALLWELDAADIGLVVSLGVADVARRRLSMRPVANLPLMYVERPAYSGAARFGKTAFDVGFAALALIGLLPVFIGVALAVKLSSRGPVFYRSERIGLGGKPFGMLKFRTMVDGADLLTADLMAVNDSVGGVLFKIKRDPRITPVGKFLRKYSLDEVPQFLNVLHRQMSVVGPRPPLRREVESYDDNVGRRLLVKPGVTGLWQVSGRSDLSWDETTRLDQSYIENWSLAGDIVIVGKTVKAVLSGNGAY